MLNDLRLAGLEAAFDRAIECWHHDASTFDVLQGAVNPIVLELAWRNCLLWHEEDKARRTDVDDSDIAKVKRAIDKLNQQRNDQIEKLDEMILAALTARKAESATELINSETPGSIVDRISIMSLKVYHMAEDSQRNDIDDEHRQRSFHKLAVLKLQRYDLYTALQQLMDDYLAGRKRMKLYKQFKMYNDPTLNPELYCVQQAGR